MDVAAQSFLDQFRSFLSFDANGRLSRVAQLAVTPALDRVVNSLPPSVKDRMPAFGSQDGVHREFARWVLSLPEEDRIACDLHQKRPPPKIHFVHGGFGLFYDFRNTDIILGDFAQAGLQFGGRILDFGCSSGRNVATLRRAFGEEVDLYGVDPVQSSINWASKIVPSACFKVNSQTPPLEFPDNYFDVVIAKSIWTHFSEKAARDWFQEIERILKPGGRFFFSSHGPQDVAHRMVYDFPAPKYEHYTGHVQWTKESFLGAVVDALKTRGFFFQSFKNANHQSDLGKIEGADTSDWGLAFMMPDFVRTSLLPKNLKLASHRACRTGNRHDGYIVVKD